MAEEQNINQASHEPIKSDKELNDEEVKEVASKVAKDFETLLKGII